MLISCELHKQVKDASNRDKDSKRVRHVIREGMLELARAEEERTQAQRLKFERRITEIDASGNRKFRGKLIDDKTEGVALGKTFYHYTEEWLDAKLQELESQRSVPTVEQVQASFAKYFTQAELEYIDTWFRDYEQLIRHIERRNCPIKMKDLENVLRVSRNMYRNESFCAAGSYSWWEKAVNAISSARLLSVPSAQVAKLKRGAFGFAGGGAIGMLAARLGLTQRLGLPQANSGIVAAVTLAGLAVFLGKEDGVLDHIVSMGMLPSLTIVLSVGSRVACGAIAWFVTMLMFQRKKGDETAGDAWNLAWSMTIQGLKSTAQELLFEVMRLLGSRNVDFDKVKNEASRTYDGVGDACWSGAVGPCVTGIVNMIIESTSGLVNGILHYWSAEMIKTKLIGSASLAQALHAATELFKWAWKGVTFCLGRLGTLLPNINMHMLFYMFQWMASSPLGRHVATSAYASVGGGMQGMATVFSGGMIGGGVMAVWDMFGGYMFKGLFSMMNMVTDSEMFVFFRRWGVVTDIYNLMGGVLSGQVGEIQETTEAEGTRKTTGLEWVYRMLAGSGRRRASLDTTKYPR